MRARVEKMDVLGWTKSDNTYVFYFIMSSGDTLVINKRPYESSYGLIWNNCCSKHIDEENIPSRNIGHFATNWCLLQYHWWRSTIFQRGNHAIHDRTSTTNFISCCNLFLNLLRCLQRLVWESKRRKDMGKFQNILPVRV